MKKGERLPLIVFLHGFLSNKGEYISDTEEDAEDYKTVEFNNLWFASRGYAVLNYDARGPRRLRRPDRAREQGLRDPRHAAPDRACSWTTGRPSGRRSPRSAARTAAARRGCSRPCAGRARRSTARWRSPKGKVVRLAAAIPQFTWTDLLFSLVPNGLNAKTTPLGVAKITLLNGFIAVIGTKMTDELAGWLARVNQGEPYDGDPVVEEAKKELTENRSALLPGRFLQGARARARSASVRSRSWRRRAGPTRSSPAVEAVRMYKRLRSIRRDYPIQLYFGDFEHLTSQIKIPDMRYYHRLGTRLLDHYMLGKKRRPRFDVRSAPTLCDPEAFGPVVRVKNWGALHPDTARVRAAGPEDDRVARSPTRAGARNRPRGDRPQAARLRHDRPARDARASPAGASRSSATLRCSACRGSSSRTRPPGRTSSSTRASGTWRPTACRRSSPARAFRVVEPGAGEQKAAYDLYGNHWHLEKGHELLLEVTGDDSTFFRRDNFPSVITVNSAKLTLPGIE